MITERGILRWRLLLGPPGEHNRVCTLHAGDAATGWLFGDSGPAVARVGQVREHGPLRLSEHADPRVRRRRADHVSGDY